VTDILLLGRNGQLGHELQRLLSARFDVQALASAELDLKDADAIRRAIGEARPSLIVNTAAYTAVDRAESDREAAFAVNATAPGVIAESAKSVGAGLVHFSTDFVFDGTRRQPYGEEDETGPLNVYGASKLAGEEAVRASGVAHLVFRTSWLYATRGTNFLLTISRLLREREKLTVVSDQTGSPTWVGELARLVDAVLPGEPAALAAFTRDHGGLYHLSCEGAVSWYTFAVRIREQLLARGETVCPIEPIPSSEYQTPARRPAYSVLSKAKFRARFGLEPLAWDAALVEAFATMPA
jgi:dTDP-4-dehydrorhamnose reductase